MTSAFAFFVSWRVCLSVGNGATPASPETIDGRYWNVLMLSSESLGDRMLGPFGFGPTPTPFAEIQSRSWRFGAAPAKTGYEPVGTLPTSVNAAAPRFRLRRCPRFFFAGLSQRGFSENTATASSPESAASRRQPSAVTLTAVGSLPVP